MSNDTTFSTAKEKPKMTNGLETLFAQLYGLITILPVTLRNLILLLAILVAFTPAAKSQHCGWDASSMIIVEPVDIASGQLIDGLNIVLTDSNSVPYSSKYNLELNKDLNIYQHTDTLKFGQNYPEPNSKPEDEAAFPFAPKDYMLIVYPNNYMGLGKNLNDRIVISDPHKRYQIVAVPYDPTKIAQMCSEKEIWNDTTYADKVKIKVYLKMK